jgi:gamma-glutamyltranspeptidase/glutathione hydrolase
MKTDFSIPNTTNACGYIPTEANFIKPFKRPLSSISPTIVEFPNGTVYIAHASAGGSRIITDRLGNDWRFALSITIDAIIVRYRLYQ